VITYEFDIQDRQGNILNAQMLNTTDHIIDIMQTSLTVSFSRYFSLVVTL